MAFVQEIRGFEAGIASRLNHTLHSLTESYEKHRQYARTVRELSKLGNRELEDLGLAPGDIRSAASYAVYGH